MVGRGGVLAARGSTRTTPRGRGHGETMYGLSEQPLEIVALLPSTDELLITKKPWLTRWTHLALVNMRKGYSPEELGYRWVLRDPASRTEWYARPWLIWIYLRFLVRLNHAKWRLLGRLVRWNLIHLTCDEAIVPRWWQLRPYPDWRLIREAWRARR